MIPTFADWMQAAVDARLRSVLIGPDEDQRRCQFCGEPFPNPTTRDIHEHECGERTAQ
jgi:hypothetical protein